MKGYMIFSLVLLSVFFGFLGYGIAGGFKEPKEPEIRRDTLWEYKYVRDTIREKIEVREEVIDTVLVVHNNTDTLYVPLNFELKTWEGENYRLKTYGFRTELRDVEIFQKTQTITEWRTKTVVEKATWSVGISAGYGYHFGVDKFTPYVGVGITYNLFSW